MKNLSDFAGQNSLITLAALAIGEAPPHSIRDQKWLLILSGVVLANQRGDNSGHGIIRPSPSFRTWQAQTIRHPPQAR
jgi:hypothetical protein